MLSSTRYPARIAVCASIPFFDNSTRFRETIFIAKETFLVRLFVCLPSLKRSDRTAKQKSEKLFVTKRLMVL